MIYLKYLWYVLRHKWLVFVECWRQGVTWRGITHDLSKFRPSEFVPYAQWFYGEYGYRFNGGMLWEHKEHKKRKADFDRAWLLHIHRNPHHWQYWLLMNDSDGGDKWTVQAHQPECGPYFLVRDSKPLLYTDDLIVSGVAHGMNPVSSSIADEVKGILNRAGQLQIIPMTNGAWKEMLADWRGAGKAITGESNPLGWYLKNKDKMILDPIVRKLTEEYIGVPPQTRSAT